MISHWRSPGHPSIFDLPQHDHLLTPYKQMSKGLCCCCCCCCCCCYCCCCCCCYLCQQYNMAAWCNNANLFVLMNKSLSCLRPNSFSCIYWSTSQCPNSLQQPRPTTTSYICMCTRMLMCCGRANLGNHNNLILCNLVHRPLLSPQPLIHRKLFSSLLVYMRKKKKKEKKKKNEDDNK